MAYWLGPEAADKVIVCLHGGGYVVPADPAQLQSPWDLRTGLCKAGHAVSIVLLSYGRCVSSPWVSFDCDANSYYRNAYKDSLDRRFMPRWAAAFLGSSERDEYNEPLRAPGSWWKGIPVDSLLILAGSDEIMVDSIQALGKKIEAVHGGTSTIVTAQECHCQPVQDCLMGYKVQGEQAKTLESWLLHRL